MFNCPPMSEELAELLRKSKEVLDAMTPEEREAMYTAQRESYMRSIRDWPKPKYTWVNGVKVYASYEDYCND